MEELLLFPCVCVLCTQQKYLSGLCGLQTEMCIFYQLIKLFHEKTTSESNYYSIHSIFMS